MQEENNNSGSIEPKPKLSPDVVGDERILNVMLKELRDLKQKVHEY